MKELHELKEKLMEELKDQAKEISKKPRLSTGDLDTVNKMVKSIDRLCEILDMDSYSEAGNWDANIRGNYGDTSSYARRRDSRGRYSRNGYSRDGYSMGGDDLVSEMEDLLHDAKNDRQRKAIERCIREMRG